ncbi:hypothetical protein Sjap_018028 [Stephania japonica]|uniref:Uncharacterized protein n=1 Tax=Stephania japonica TaxID=461633 RepID=A0AAP0I7F1_9MAGN
MGRNLLDNRSLQPKGSLTQQECLEFAAATASLRVQVKGTFQACLRGKQSWIFLVLDISRERFYFGDHILPCFETGIPLLKQRLHQLPDAKNISIAFPDDGAWKRESLFLKAIENKAPFEVLSLAGSIADALQI